MLFKCDSFNLQLHHPLRLGQFRFRSLTFQAHKWLRNKYHAKLNSVMNQVSISQKATFLEAVNPKPYIFMILSPCSAAISVSLATFRARGKKCGFITHAGQNTLFFFTYFLHKKTACERHPGRLEKP